MNQKHLHNKFNEVYAAESDAIFRFCIFRVNDREQALDLVQETFTRFWKSLSGGMKIDKHRAFIFTIAQRLIIDWYRKKKPISMNDLGNEETGEAFDPGDDETLGVALEMKSEARFLLSKISEINPSYRQAVYLRYVEGLSPPEIGDVLGITANAASVRVNRGLIELRKLTDYNE